jgi:hypothetical protein
VSSHVPASAVGASAYAPHCRPVLGFSVCLVVAPQGKTTVSPLVSNVLFGQTLLRQQKAGACAMVLGLPHVRHPRNTDMFS